MTSPVSMEQVIKNFVTEKIALSEKDRKTNVALVDVLLKKLIQEMRSQDGLFATLYQQNYYAGSYFENLKVAVTDEFDINVVLKLPFKWQLTSEQHVYRQQMQRQAGAAVTEAKRWVHQRNKSATVNSVAKSKRAKKGKEKLGGVGVVVDSKLEGFAQVKLRQPLHQMLQCHPTLKDKYEGLRKLFDDNTQTLLSSEKLNYWMQSVVTRAMTSMLKNGYKPKAIASMKFSESGPAKTLKLIKKDGSKISVDLVPVIRLTPSILEAIVTCLHFYEIPLEKKREGFVVPKLPPSGKDTFFRVSIPDAERHLLLDKNYAKTLIRIFKRLKEIEKWSVASYQIKTVFSWKLLEEPDPHYWKESQMVALFLEMLKKFKEAVAKRHLSHIFFRDFNLLSSLTQNEATPLSYRLDNIIKIVETNKAKELKDLLYR